MDIIKLHDNPQQLSEEQFWSYLKEILEAGVPGEEIARAARTIFNKDSSE